MRTTPTGSIETRDDLSVLVATLCSYENLFGPYHPQTLALLVQAGEVFLQNGEADRARLLLERAVQDVARVLGRDHDLRIRAIAALRDVLIRERNIASAATLQKELLECQILRLGTEHPETVAVKADFAVVLFGKLDGPNEREV